MSKTTEIILGIDPGTSVMGYGLILAKPKPELIQLGVLRLRKFDNHHQKLQQIFETTQRIIREYKPTACAIEAPFYGKNVQSMLKLGRAQGTAIAAAMSAGVLVTEYSPKKIKVAVTGNGNASKEQVAGMLCHILKDKSLKEKIPLDATDGLAAAICHFYQLNKPTTAGSSAKNWNEFIKQNPSKVVKR